MEVIETASEGLRRELNVIVPRSDLEGPANEKLAEIGRSTKIPGFRAGKVPMSVLKRRFWNSVRESVVRDVLAESVQRVLKEQGLDPVDQPSVSITQFKDGADLEYSLTVDVKPVIEPIDFSSIELERPVVEISDEFVQSEMEEMASHLVEYMTVAERAAEAGDAILADVRLHVDGMLIPNGEMKDRRLILHKDRMPPDQIQYLLGARAGETRTYDGPLPPDFTEENAEPAHGSYTVDIKEVQEARRVEVSDDLAVEMGLDNLAALRENVREQFSSEFTRMSNEIVKAKLFARLREKLDFEVPRGLFETQLDLLKSNADQAGQAAERDSEEEPKSEEEKEALLVPIARWQVRKGLLVLDIASKHGLVASDDEVKLGLINFVRRQPGMTDAMAKNLLENPGLQEQVRYDLIEQKVVDFICELAKISERRFTPEEFRAEMKTIDTDDEALETAQRELTDISLPSA